MAMAVARAGDSTAAQGFVERALRFAKESAAAPARFGAMALVGLDDDRAVRMLERMRPRGVLFRATLRMPEFDPIRDHPRFQALLAEYEN
jgi:hypothetical protein